MQTPTEPTPPTIRKEPGVSSCTPDIKIDPEFEALVRPLTPDEYEGLKRSIEMSGCLDPLVVWDEENILLDGHHRKKICEEIGKPYQVVRVSFHLAAFARRLAVQKNANRRHLTPTERGYLIGKHALLLMQGTQAEQFAAARFKQWPGDEAFLLAVEEEQAKLDAQIEAAREQDEDDEWPPRDESDDDDCQDENVAPQVQKNQLGHYGQPKPSKHQIENKLAASYGVGRTTVRRAMDRYAPAVSRPVERRTPPVARHESKDEWALERLIRAFDGATPSVLRDFKRLRYEKLRRLLEGKE